MASAAVKQMHKVNSKARAQLEAMLEPGETLAEIQYNWHGLDLTLDAKIVDAGGAGDWARFAYTPDDDLEIAGVNALD